MYISWWEIILLLAALEIYDGHIHRNPQTGNNDALLFYVLAGYGAFFLGLAGIVLWFLYRVTFGA
jgi:hypothetical protein